MEMLEKKGRIERARLSGENYFQTLIEEAASVGLLADAEIENLQLGCLQFLAKLSEQYNNGDSSSIRVETAQAILTSILYTIGVYLKSFSLPEDGVDALRREPIEDLYRRGRQQVDKMMGITRLLHSRMIPTLLETPNIYYRATVVEGIGGFFKLYRPEYFAQETHITADYPTYRGVSDLSGIEFIKKYLEAIYYENDFCSRFPAKNIYDLLCGFDKGYENLLFNLFEPVLFCGLGCVLVHSDVRNLHLSPYDVNYLEQLFSGSTGEKKKELLTAAAEELGSALSLSGSTRQYLRDGLEQAGRTIDRAVADCSIKRVFLTPRYPANTPELRCNFGSKMDDEIYRKIVQAVVRCPNSAEKIALIKEGVHSLVDLEELLLDAEMEESEILAVLRELSPGELAAFVKRHLAYSEWEMSELRANEILLHDCLHRLVEQLPSEQQKWIYEAAKIIEII